MPGGGSSYPIVPRNSNRTVSSTSGSWGANNYGCKNW